MAVAEHGVDGPRRVIAYVGVIKQIGQTLRLGGFEMDN
jgi:hypothetical protein